MPDVRRKRTMPHGLPFAPIKIGVLIDIDMGTKEDFLATLRLGFDEAYESGLITRQVPIGQWADAYTRGPDDIKTILDFSAGSP